MNLLGFNITRNKLNLTETNRQAIYRLFGSFTANKLAMSGINGISNSYESNVDVYSVIKKIIDISKSVPWVVEQYMGGRWKVLSDTTIHELMANPNRAKGYTWNDVEEQVLLYLLCTGNTYIHGESQLNSNLIEEVDVLPSPNVCIEVTNRDWFMPEYYYQFDLGTTKRKIEKEKINHIKLFNPSYNTTEESLYGLSPIQVAARVVQVGNDTWDASANLLQNRGAIGMITDKSTKPMTPTQAEDAQTALDERLAGTDKFGKVIITNKDLSFIPLAMSSTDLELIKRGVITTRALCNVFGLNSTIFNDPDNKTYNNMKEAEKAMYSNCIQPLSDKIAEHLTLFIANNHFPHKNVRMRQDFSQIECLQEDLNEKSKPFIELRRIGAITANDINRALGTPVSSDPEADKLLVVGGGFTPPPTVGGGAN